MRVNLFSNWANGSPGLLWWCASDQTNLTDPPYSWCMIERELGLLDVNHKPKPALQVMRDFSEWMSGLDFDLPPAKTDAVCIATLDQDHWGISYMSYILAKQAGANIRFAYAGGAIPDAPVYLLPSLSGARSLLLPQYKLLRERVKNGTTLYISNDDAYLSEFQDLTGLRVLDSARSPANGWIYGLPYEKRWQFFLETAGAVVLETDENDEPLFTRHTYGKGTVYYLNFPLEKSLLYQENAFDMLSSSTILRSRSLFRSTSRRAVYCGGMAK